MTSREWICTRAEKTACSLEIIVFLAIVIRTRLLSTLEYSTIPIFVASYSYQVVGPCATRERYNQAHRAARR